MYVVITKVKHGKYDNDNDTEKHCFVTNTLKTCKNNILKNFTIF